MNKNHAVRKKTDMTEYIEAQLRYWAKWVKNKQDLKFQNKTGKKSLSHKDINPTAYVEPNMDDHLIERIEKAIRLMPIHLRKVLEKYYLCTGSVKQKAEELNIARVTFHEYLRMGKYWLLGYWSKKPTSTW